MRDQGFPPKIVRAIVSAQISEAFADRRKAIEVQAADRPFWESTTPDSKTLAAQQELSREMTKLVRDVLGNDMDDVTRTSLRRQFGNVPDDKLERLRQIQEDYSQRQTDIALAARIGNTTILTDDYGQKMNALQKQRDAELAAVLSPEEFENYALRSSNTASQVRNNLQVFNPTEDEFRTVFQLQKAFDERFGNLYATPSQEEMRARSEAQQRLTQDIKAALGPERGADYERSMNYDYRRTSLLVQRLELPPETANQLWAIQQDLQERMRTTRATSLAERNAQMTALNAEATTRVTSVLGPRGFEAYKQNTSWMQSLRPATPPPATGPAIPR